MALLQDLIAQIDDPALRERIQNETDRLLKQKKFGLVFEEHLPECTPLWDAPIRVGTKVAPKTGYMNDIHVVTKIDGNQITCFSRLTKELEEFERDEVVAIAEFGEPIYPYLKPVDTVCNAPDSNLWHALIEADNYHALQLLEYLYAGKVDCIYIDPPYNTGARDWKYNNDYVDSSDAYRHSKWLSMMQKRLKIAKRLLNPKDSVLIVTIDEKEVYRLCMLLDDLFPYADIQVITDVINPKGAARFGRFSRVEENIIFCFIGSSSIVETDSTMLDDKESDAKAIEWLGLRRGEPSSIRPARPNQFYPIFVDIVSGHIVEIGDPIPLSVNRHTVDAPVGTVALWPVNPAGSERLWGLTPDSLRRNWEKGYVRINSWNSSKQTGTVKYLPSGTIEKIESGLIEITGRDEQGAVIGEYFDGAKTISPRKVWNKAAHNAQIHGTSLIEKTIGKRFTYPKSLYAVQDALRFIVANKPNALIVDFFAGSGTTLHAVNLLNAEDGGNRRCILVTNNEVSDAEAKQLAKEGYKPGDEEWERLGIARYVTWPRTVCSIEGHDVSGKPLKGTYLGSDRPMADGFESNAAFFKLGFLDKTSVALGRQFAELLPTLWMKAGAVGPCPALDGDALPAMLVLPENAFAVLIDEEAYPEFEKQLADKQDIQTAFIITDSQSAYREMIKGLQAPNTFQLYRDYLDNFRINTQR